MSEPEIPIFTHTSLLSSWQNFWLLFCTFHSTVRSADRRVFLFIFFYLFFFLHKSVLIHYPLLSFQLAKMYLPRNV